MEHGIYLELEDGSIIGHANTEDWDNAKWYHKLIGWFWRGYKNRFIKPEPFKAGLKPNLRFTEEDNNFVL